MCSQHGLNIILRWNSTLYVGYGINEGKLDISAAVERRVVETNLYYAENAFFRHSFASKCDKTRLYQISCLSACLTQVCSPRRILFPSFTHFFRRPLIQSHRPYSLMSAFFRDGLGSFCKWLNRGCSFKIRAGAARCGCKSEAAEFYVEEGEPGNLYILFMPPRVTRRSLMRRRWEPLKLKCRATSLKSRGLLSRVSSDAPHRRGSFDFKAARLARTRESTNFISVPRQRLEISTAYELLVRSRDCSAARRKTREMIFLLFRSPGAPSRRLNIKQFPRRSWIMTPEQPATSWWNCCEVYPGSTRSQEVLTVAETRSSVISRITLAHISNLEAYAPT